MTAVGMCRSHSHSTRSLTRLAGMKDTGRGRFSPKNSIRQQKDYHQRTLALIDNGKK